MYIQKKGFWLKIAILTFLFITLVFLPVRNSLKEKRIRVVFRYDDYSSLSDTAIETKLLKTFKHFDIPLTVGVIPRVYTNNTGIGEEKRYITLSGRKQELLRGPLAEGWLEVALHGLTHENLSDGARKQYIQSEFSGLNLEQQVAKLRKGRALVEEWFGEKVNTFIPPFNSYDETTLRALEQVDIRNISAGPGGPANSSIGVRYLPATCKITELRSAVNSARRSWDKQPMIMVMFHAYDFREVGGENGILTYKKFEELVRWVTLQKDVSVQTIDDCVNSDSSFGSKRLREYQAFIRLKVRNYLPAFLGRLMNVGHGLYPEMISIKTDRVRIYDAVLIFYILVLILSLAVSNVFKVKLWPLFKLKDRYLKLGSLAMAIMGTLYIAWDLEVYQMGLILIAFLFGAAIGVWYPTGKSPKG